MLQSISGDAAAKWTAQSPIVLAYGWVRKSDYSSGHPTAYTTMSL